MLNLSKKLNTFFSKKNIDKMIKYYEPSTEETDIKSVGYIRQNPWGKCYQGALDFGFENIIHIPWAHYNDIVQRYEETGEVEIQNRNGKQIANAAINFPINSIVYIPGKETLGVLVRIVSGVKSDFLSSPLIIRKGKTCNHPYIHSQCQICRDSIVEVGYPNRDKMLTKGYLFEPFSTLYRDTQLIGMVRFPEGVDKMIGARRDTVGKKQQYWRLSQNQEQGFYQ
jgi:hypothetical protein